MVAMALPLLWKVLEAPQLLTQPPVQDPAAKAEDAADLAEHPAITLPQSAPSPSIVQQTRSYVLLSHPGSSESSPTPGRA